MKYIATKDVDIDGWEFEAWEIKKGTICEVDDWDRCSTLMYQGKAVCDEDSKMCNEYFSPLNDN